MSLPLGDYNLNDVINTKFNTLNFSTSGLTSFSGLPVSIAVYKDNSTTEITTGITITTDFDNIIGLNHVQIDLSQSASYSAGSDYDAVLTAGTVSGISVIGYIPFNFSIENRNTNLSTTERNAVADAFLNRDMSLGTDSGSSTVRTVRQALRFLRNKWTIISDTLSIKKEDDSTESWSAILGSTSTANPITSIDPVGP